MTKLYLAVTGIFISVLLILVFFEPIKREGLALFGDLNKEASTQSSTKELTDQGKETNETTSRTKSSDGIKSLMVADPSLLDLEAMEVQYKSSTVEDRVYLDGSKTQIIKGQLLITPYEGVEEGDFFRLLLGLGGKVVGINRVVNEYQVTFEDPIGTKVLLDNHTDIEYALYNVVLDTTSISEDAWVVTEAYVALIHDGAVITDMTQEDLVAIMAKYNLIDAQIGGLLRLQDQNISERLSLISEEIYKDYGYLLWSEVGSYVANRGFVPTDIVPQEMIVRTGVDQVWQMRADMLEVNVGVIDVGFEQTYIDLPLKEDQIFFDGDVTNVTHGSHVLGIISATHDNGIGIAGVGINAKPYIYEWMDFASIKQGFSKMMDEGIQVINMSVGMNAALDEAYRQEIQENASDYINTLLGSVSDRDQPLVLIGAGNEGEETTAYQLFIPDLMNKDNVLVVGSVKYNYVTSALELAAHSCYGEQVDLLAPGENILSIIGEDNYGLSTGTSMSTPFVAGVASMIWGLYPDLTASELKEALLKTEDYVSYMGQIYPVVNAKVAVDSLLDQQ